MSEFFDTLSKISSTLDDVNGALDDVQNAVDTANYGVKRTRDSGENINRVIKRIESGENDRGWQKVEEYEKKEFACIRRTFLFCILVIIVTVLWCVFL